MKKSAITGLAVGVLLAAGASAPAMAVDSGKSDLSVLHGIPGLTVDVYVNGVNTLGDFAPGTLAGPSALTRASTPLRSPRAALSTTPLRFSVPLTSPSRQT